LALDRRIGRHYGDQIELERRYSLLSRAGALRLLAFRNRAVMGSYEAALALASGTGTAPDLAATRTTERVKYGYGINLEQALTDNVGAFARASWNNGQTETYAFTEIDRSLSAGISVTGTRWQRPRDSAGIAIVRNGLSHAHRDYLAAGGLGFFLGDGRLDYRPEMIAETYYSIRAAKALWISLDYQHVNDPGYNAARGPVNLWSARVHTEF
jgi:carbohydrate-selective porin OprB